MIAFATAILLQSFPASADERKTGTFTPLIPQTGSLSMGSSSVEIDYTNMAQGYLMCRYRGKADRAIVQLKKEGGTLYNHLLSADGVSTAITITDGSGLYEIGVYEHLESNQYRSVYTGTVKVELADALLPFLYSSAAVPFVENSACVLKAREITAGCETMPEKIGAVYRFVTEEISYDTALAASVSAWYRSDLDRVLIAQKGICVDYAVLAAAMLRSLGVPTQVVYGYTADYQYHAWISVYTDTDGEFLGCKLQAGNWRFLDPTFDAGLGGGTIYPTDGYMKKLLY